MTQMIDGLIKLGADWTNLVTANPTLASSDTVIQNYGPAAVRIFYGATQPTTESGIVINAGGVWGGNAAGIFVHSLGGEASISVGLA